MSLRLVLAALLFFALACAVNENRADRLLERSVALRALPEGPERDAVRDLLDRAYFCARADVMTGPTQLAILHSFEDAAADGALATAEVEALANAVEPCAGAGPTGAALADALVEKRRAEDALAAAKPPMAPMAPKTPKTPKTPAEPRRFADWEKPGRVLEATQRAGWTLLDECVFMDDAEDMHKCLVQKDGRVGEIYLTEYRDEAAARDAMKNTMPTASEARDGAWVLTIYGWEEKEAETLLTTLAPPGEPLRALSAEVLTQRMEAAGWRKDECAVADGGKEARCVFTRPGGLATTDLDISEPAPPGAEEREVVNGKAAVLQGDADLDVKISSAEVAAGLMEALFAPDTAATAAMEAPPAAPAASSGAPAASSGAGGE